MTALSQFRWMPAAIGTAIALALCAGAPAGAAPRPRVGPAVNVSGACGAQNAEVESAVDPRRGYVYEEWIGCDGIGLARSSDGGRTFSKPITLPGSKGARFGSWDPSVAVAPDGTVYAGFMTARDDRTFPVVDASYDHGATFSPPVSLLPPEPRNWGDREFLAVGPDGTLYVTWDYGPSASEVTFICAANGSCSFATGDLNVVLQKSTDHGRTFGPMSYISPGFPASGADSAPLVVEPGGRIDVLYQGYRVTDPSTLALGPATSYFTSSSDGGRTWSAPRAVGADAGTMSAEEWWIDGDIALDGGGNLYATWDTQGFAAPGSREDIGWLSYSTDHGQTWSRPVQVPPERLNVPHIVQAVGGVPGVAYVGWLSDSNPLGYAQYLRTFSISRGWLGPPVQVSRQFGSAEVWPGDTFGISLLAPGRLILSWGSAVPGNRGDSEIFAARVGVG